MLVLTVRKNGSIELTGGIRITVGELRRNGVRLLIEAPQHVNIRRDNVKAGPRELAPASSWDEAPALTPIADIEAANALILGAIGSEPAKDEPRSIDAGRTARRSPRRS